MYAFLRGLLRFIVHVYLAGLWTLRGAGNVPREGGVLVCSNHMSAVDTAILPGFLPRPDSWSLGKSELFEKGPFERWLFTAYHAFPIVRHTADRRALKRVFETLQRGEVLIVYPEGTRIDEGGLRRPEPGAGFIAMRSGAPVVPAALAGTRACFPKSARFPRRVPVSLTFGRPFRVARERPDGSRVEAQAAADAIMLGIAELLPEGLRGEYADLDAWRGRVGDLRVYG